MQATSYSPKGWEEHWEGRVYDRENRPETYLEYPDALFRIELGEPSFPKHTDLWSTFRARRSKRNFIEEPMTLNELNILLWSSQGITADMGDYQLRTAPSSGALYPIETYMIINNVEGLKPGIYHLNVKNWQLECLEIGDFRESGQKVLLGQTMTRCAAVNFIWTAVLERCKAKYHERAYRYIWWDSAVVAENMQLSATGLGLGTSLMGAWFDDLAHDLLDIDGKSHFSVLTASVGKVSGTDWREDRRPPK
jgi:SagB-type dehydrogenase family enzyme